MSDSQLKRRMQSAATARNTKTVMALLNEVDKEIKQANEDLDKELDTFIERTMKEAGKHRLLKGSTFLEQLETYKRPVTRVGGNKKRTKKNKK